jgi:type I restriction enzyme S subunit
VAKIEALAAKIERAFAVRREATKEAYQLYQSQMNLIFSRLASKYPVRPFGSFDHHVTSGPRYWGGDKYSEHGFRFYRAQDIGPDGNVLSTSKAYVIPPEGQQGRTATLSHGDLMIVITGATVGRCSLFTEGLEPGFVSQHVALCRLPKNEIEPRYALWCLISPFGQNQLLGQRYGQGKPGLNLTNIRMIEVPLPPINEQRRIVTYLDGFQAQVNALKKLQAQTATEVDALLPAILDRAFKGEL